MSPLFLKALILSVSISLVSCTVPLAPALKGHLLKAKLKHHAFATKLALRKALFKAHHHLNPANLLLKLKHLPGAHLVKSVTKLVDPLHLSKIPAAPRNANHDLLNIGLRQKKVVSKESYEEEDVSVSKSQSHWVHSLRENIPPADRARHFSRNFISRAFRSFINHDEHTLDDVSPLLQPLHHVLQTTGSFLLPAPENEGIGEPIEPLLIHSWPNIPH